jgi:predicted nucleotide-binding protein
MTKFNITNSKVEQLSDTGNNYKFVGKSETDTLSEQGDVVQPVGIDNKAEAGKTAAMIGEFDAASIEHMPLRPYKRPVSQSFSPVEYQRHIQKAVLDSGVEENELSAIGGRRAVVASIWQHFAAFNPTEAQTPYAPAWVKLKPILIHRGLNPVDETTTLTDIKAFLDAATDASAGERDPAKTVVVRSQEAVVADPRNVFVIHGRNRAARDAIFDFLRAVGLNPIEWGEAISMTGKGSPYIGEILDVAFSNAQAIVAVLTGDDLAYLRTEFQEAHDPEHEKEPTPQARQNVLFEAGMAFGRHPERTIMVQLGALRLFSDVAGRHTLNFQGTPESRTDLRDRLKTAKCAVKEVGTDWLKAGNFDEALRLALVSTAGKRSKPR